MGAWEPDDVDAVLVAAAKATEHVAGHAAGQAAGQGAGSCG
jgi:hypothetical protein